MATIKEQINVIQKNQKNNNQLEKKLQTHLQKHQDLIITGLKYEVSAVKSINGYSINILPKKLKNNITNAYEITITEPLKRRNPICYFKAIIKNETTTDPQIFDIHCHIQKNNQRLSHCQIIDFITQTFGI